MKAFRFSYKGFFVLLSFGLICFWAYRLYLELTDDFRLANITFEMPYKADWTVETPSSSDSPVLQNLLNQPFNYIGKGAQTYVFLSTDEKYVIKFFKFKHLKPSFWMSFVPVKYREANLARKQKKLDRVFKGYLIAYQDYKYESGLIYIHLNPHQQDFEKTLTLHDKLGFTRTINLDSVVFVVQEAGTTFQNTLKPLLKTGDYTNAKEKIGRILDLYFREYNKGLHDIDYRVLDNTGFVGDRAIHMDVGMLRRDNLMKSKEGSLDDLEKIAYTIKHWVQKQYPKAAEEITSFMQSRISNQVGLPFNFDKNDDQVFKRNR